MALLLEAATRQDVLIFVIALAMLIGMTWYKVDSRLDALEEIAAEIKKLLEKK